MIIGRNKRNLWQYYLIIVLGFFVIFQGYALFGSKLVNYFFFQGTISSDFISDSLRLGGNIIRDLFYWNYGLSGWQFMPRPAFFPNLVVQAAVVPWGLNPILSNLIYSILMCLVTLLALFLLLYQAAGKAAMKRICVNIDVNPDKFLSWQEVLIFCLGFFSICLFIASKTNFLTSLFTTFHLENLINTLLYFYVMVRFLQKPTKWGVLWVSIMIFLGLISNRLFLVTAMIPAWFAILYLLVGFKEGSFKRLFVWTLWQGLVALLSLLVYLFPSFINGNAYLLRNSDSSLSFVQRFKDLFTFYHSSLAACFMIFVFISLFGLFLHACLNFRNKSTGKNALASWQFMLIAALLAGGFNLILFLVSKGLIAGLNRYLIVACFFTPAIFLFLIYKYFPKLMSFVYVVLGIFFVGLIYRQPINYKIYTQQNPNDGSLSYKLANCLSTYSKQGYVFQDGLANYGISIKTTYRNNLGVYLGSLHSIPNAKNEIIGFYFSKLIMNSLHNINAPNSNEIRHYNFMVFENGSYLKYLPFSSIPQAIKFYGKPEKMLSCGADLKIAYYGTHSAQKHFNKILYQQLTCQDKAANQVREAHYRGFLKKISHKVPKFLSKKLGINSADKQNEAAAKIHNFYDCRPVNNYLKAHPVYKKQVDAILKS